MFVIVLELSFDADLDSPFKRAAQFEHECWDVVGKERNVVGVWRLVGDEHVAATQATFGIGFAELAEYCHTLERLRRMDRWQHSDLRRQS
jgi:hypothetical protein